MSREKQGLLDHFTRSDELLAEMIPLLKRINAGEITVQLPEGPEGQASIEDLLELLRYQHEKNYEIHFFTYPNDGTKATLGVGDTVLDFAAGTIKDSTGTVTKMSNSLMKLQLDFLRSVAINSDEQIVVQLDTKDKILVKADNWFVGTYQQFTRIIITCTSVTDLFLLCCTNPEAIIEMIGESTVSIGREERNQALTDKDSHFTGALATNAIEFESITSIVSNEITLTALSIQSDQALHFRAWLFETDAYSDVDLDVDQFVEFVDLDLATDGARIAGAGQYYLAATDLNVDYEDLDGTKELHIGLQNLDAVAKNAGATGEVKLKCSYIPRT